MKESMRRKFYRIYFVFTNKQKDGIIHTNDKLVKWNESKFCLKLNSFSCTEDDRKCAWSYLLWYLIFNKDKSPYPLHLMSAKMRKEYFKRHSSHLTANSLFPSLHSLSLLSEEANVPCLLSNGVKDINSISCCVERFLICEEDLNDSLKYEQKISRCQNLVKVNSNILPSVSGEMGAPNFKVVKLKSSENNGMTSPSVRNSTLLQTDYDTSSPVLQTMVSCPEENMSTQYQVSNFEPSFISLSQAPIQTLFLGDSSMINQCSEMSVNAPLFLSPPISTTGNICLLPGSSQASSIASNQPNVIDIDSLGNIVQVADMNNLNIVLSPLTTPGLNPSTFISENNLISTTNQAIAVNPPHSLNVPLISSSVKNSMVKANSWPCTSTFQTEHSVDSVNLQASLGPTVRESTYQIKSPNHKTLFVEGTQDMVVIDDTEDSVETKDINPSPYGNVKSKFGHLGSLSKYVAPSKVEKNTKVSQGRNIVILNPARNSISDLNSSSPEGFINNSNASPKALLQKNVNRGNLTGSPNGIKDLKNKITIVRSPVKRASPVQHDIAPKIIKVQSLAMPASHGDNDNVEGSNERNSSTSCSQNKKSNIKVYVKEEKEDCTVDTKKTYHISISKPSVVTDSSQSVTESKNVFSAKKSVESAVKIKKAVFKADNSNTNSASSVKDDEKEPLNEESEKPVFSTASEILKFEAQEKSTSNLSMPNIHSLQASKRWKFSKERVHVCRREVAPLIQQHDMRIQPEPKLKKKTPRKKMKVRDISWDEPIIMLSDNEAETLDGSPIKRETKDVGSIRNVAKIVKIVDSPRKKDMHNKQDEIAVKHEPEVVEKKNKKEYVWKAKKRYGIMNNKVTYDEKGKKIYKIKASNFFSLSKKRISTLHAAKSLNGELQNAQAERDDANKRLCKSVKITDLVDNSCPKSVFLSEFKLVSKSSLEAIIDAKTNKGSRVTRKRNIKVPARYSLYSLK